MAHSRLSGALQPVIDDHLGTTFPALALAVVRDGDLLLDAAWGWLDPETQARPTRPEALFDLASVTKLFTVTAFLGLVSEGRAALDDPLVSVVPEFGATGPRPLDGGQDPHTRAPLPMPDAARGQMADPARVTFRHLLTHTSGLAPWRDVYAAAGPPPPPPDQPDPLPRETRWAHGLRALCVYPFVGQPGDGIVRYSDLGLMLLGEAAARLHGTPGDLETVIRARVLEPLGLASATFNPLRHGNERTSIAPTEFDADWRGRRCWGEVHDENACGLGGVAGHAGLFAAARDVAALGAAWLEADPRLGIAPDLVREATRQHAASDSVRRGLGWLLKSDDDSSAGALFSPASFGHTGFTGTSLWIDPERRLVVACLTNRVYRGRHFTGILAFRRALHDAIAREVDHA
ncbi:MAG: beta-lactamase family protein [Chloroflexi bacterium]|nr:beta-lactamase family protein [Chloroflexota bacterium]